MKTDRDLGRLEESLLLLADAIPKGKADELRKQIGANRKLLQGIKKDLAGVADRTSEVTVEGKLVEILVDIERRQREQTQKLEKMRGNVVEDILRDLLQGPPRMK